MRLLAVFVLAMLSGCSSLYRAQPDKTPLEMPLEFVSHLPACKTGQSWVELLGSPILVKLIEKAELQNLSLAELSARVREAEANAIVTQVTILPRLDSESASNFEHRYGDRSLREDGTTNERNTGTINTAIRASWEVPLFGRAESVNQQAAAGILLAKADLEAARFTVRSEIASSYTQMINAQKRLKIVTQISELQQRNAELVFTRYNNQIASKFDVARANQSLARSQVVIPQIEQDANVARLRLTTLLGSTQLPQELFQLSDHPKIPNTAISHAPADLLRLRPDIRRAEAAVLQQAAELGIAKANIFPRLTLGGGPDGHNEYTRKTTDSRFC